MIKKVGITLATGLLFSQSALAYKVHVCSNGKTLKWDTNRITMYTLDMSSSEHGAVDYAVDRWNENPSNFRITLKPQSELKYPLFRKKKSTSNRRNEIYWVSEVNGDNSSGQELTRKSCSAGEIRESDIILSASSTRNVKPTLAKSEVKGYAGSARSLQALTIHELGHTVGLLHDNSVFSVMGDQYRHGNSNGSSLRYYAGENAADGLVDLYGRNSSSDIQDIAVSHWRYDEKNTDPEDEYSSHRRTKVLDSSGGDTISSFKDSTSREPVYKVKRGQTVQVEFTYENNGETTHTDIDTEFYISSNNYISASDRLVKKFTNMNLGRNEVYTRSRKITIPNDLTINKRYWIGVIVDSSDNVKNEVSDANNRTYTEIKIID